MAPQTSQPDASGSESSRTTGASSVAPPAEAQQQRRHQLVHCDAANAATANMAQPGHSNIVRKAWSSENTNQQIIRSEELHTEADIHQLLIQWTAGVGRELHEEFIAARNSKPPCWTMTCVCIVHAIEHYDVVSSVPMTAGWHDKRRREWKN